MKTGLIWNRFLLIILLSDLSILTQLAYEKDKGISLIFGLALGFPADPSGEASRSLCRKLSLFSFDLLPV